jgi:hypothetical protein
VRYGAAAAVHLCRRSRRRRRRRMIAGTNADLGRCGVNNDHDNVTLEPTVPGRRIVARGGASLVRLTYIVAADMGRCPPDSGHLSDAGEEADGMVGWVPHCSVFFSFSMAAIQEHDNHGPNEGRRARILSRARGEVVRGYG